MPITFCIAQEKILSELVAILNLVQGVLYELGILLVNRNVPIRMHKYVLVIKLVTESWNFTLFPL